MKASPTSGAFVICGLMLHYLKTAAASFAAFLVTACSTDTILTPEPTQFVGNGRAEKIDGITRHDALASLPLLVDGPRLKITAVTTIPQKYIVAANLTVLVNGEYFTTLKFKSVGKETFKLALPGIGLRQIELIEGTQVKEGERGPLGFTTITQIATPKGFVTTIPVHQKAREGIVVFSDSHGVGGGVVDAGLWAWPKQLGRLRHADVFLTGYCSAQLGAHLDTQAKRDKMTREAVERLQGYEHQVYYVQAGFNDFAYATYTPAQLTEFYQLWLPQLRKALPNARIIVEIEGPVADEKARSLGFTLQQYREAEEAGAAGFAEVVKNMWELSGVVDGTHLGEPAETDKAHKLNAILN
jgi:hypothetical protein